MPILLFVIDVGPPLGSHSFNISAGHQCPRRPDPGCRVPWPPNVRRALHPPPEELDREAERQRRGPGRSKWKQMEPQHLPPPRILRGLVLNCSHKGRQALSHWPISLSLLTQQSAFFGTDTNICGLEPWATQEGKAPRHHSNHQLAFQKLAPISHPVTCPGDERWERKRGI